MEAVRILTCEPAFNLFCCAVLVKVYEENPAPPPRDFGGKGKTCTTLWEPPVS